MGAAIPQEIEQLRTLFDGVPACWHFWPDVDSPEIPELLRRRGLELFETEPLMMLADPGRAVYREHGRPEPIEDATGDAGLAEWARLWSGVPEVDDLVPVHRGVGANRMRSSTTRRCSPAVWLADAPSRVHYR
ncbi:hypothetical protein [Nocardia sp. NRRL WC-3656]|uniref:hypothetical protein n=1 Tax=Nocardia sp. NRRL WC-3656 TaxID=1463824 RepID=UPI0004C42EF3|nr:hypothetical protein [Nocardia sp. NRRL WC-3656]